ncbi:uncharacterized protein [Henckelia pumila]|uniref:uncharacterized protein n=1 Tax=Henckelia pumila TaxID=405737 RepID=UPI003C6E71E1
MEIPYSGTAQRPPILDGSNYVIWKVRMRVYIKSIDEKTWQRVLQGWNPPRRTDGEGDFPLKPETDWNADETAALNMNNKSLNVLFTSLDSNMFSLVTNCVCAKQAWEKLQMHCEGSDSVRRTKRRILTTQFQNLRMEEMSKVLRSLPERIQMKICAIDESKDTSILGLDELMSSLQTYELEMNFGKKDKGKSIALQVSNNSYHDFVDLTQGVNESDLGDDSIAFLTKQFGFGHFANECPTRLHKEMCASLSDDEDEEGTEQGEEETHNALTVLEAGEVELSWDNAQKMYEELYNDWILRNKTNSALTKENSELKASVARLEVVLSKKDLELGMVKEELETANATLAKFNSSKTKLDSILMMGKDDRAGLGFHNSKFEVGESSKTVFVKENSNSAKSPTAIPKEKPIPLKTQTPVQGKSKGSVGLFVITVTSKVTSSLTVSNSGHWYFDNGSSRHMTGLKKYLSDYVEQDKGKVTYGGGANGKIVGQGTLNIEGLPKLHNVLHVEGLNANLISISQLCDDDLYVKFDKKFMSVFDKSNSCALTGSRSSDNCYQLGEDFACKFTKVDDLNLWHQKLGHANFKALKKLSKYEAVRGMSNLTFGVPYVCGYCQKGKQTRVSHPVLQHCGTTRCLELLHMDLMGPMEVESCGGKRYSFVCVDDFSRYSWVIRIRTDHGKEFENSLFDQFCENEDLKGKTIEEYIDDVRPRF